MENVDKSPLIWEAPEQESASKTAYFLKIDDTYFLNIDDTYKLQINNTTTGTNWTVLG
tara:strand:- start:89 stop:262 length:174 start_codon:yes stop_codon:yes gene_type:complete